MGDNNVDGEESMIKRSLAAICAGVALLGGVSAFGQNAPAPPAPAPAGAQLTGEQIMQKVRDNQYSDTMDAVIVMTLTDKNGISQTKRFRIQRNKDNVLIRFLDPPDIKDTGYLIIQDKDQKTLVYVYFPPPTDDYRQINVDSDESNQAFLGSDFDVTDFQLRDPGDTENKFIKTETISGIECQVVESIPKDPNYKYGKVITWVRSDYWLPIRIQFFDRQGKLVKDMKVKKFKSVGDKKVASSSEMTSVANEHKTLLDLQDIQFDVKFPDDNFTIRRLTKP
jgi:outer membrane lipoprotein-sorting protein